MLEFKQARNSIYRLSLKQNVKEFFKEQAKVRGAKFGRKYSVDRNKLIKLHKQDLNVHLGTRLYSLTYCF